MSLKSVFPLLSEHFPSSLALPVSVCESSLKHQHRNSWKFFVPYKGPPPPPLLSLYCSLTLASHSFSLTNVFISPGAFISLLPTFSSIPYSRTDELLYTIWIGSLFYINCIFPLKATLWTFLFFFFFLTCFQTPFPVIVFQPWRHLLSQGSLLFSNMQQCTVPVVASTLTGWFFSWSPTLFFLCLGKICGLPPETQRPVKSLSAVWVCAVLL